MQPNPPTTALSPRETQVLARLARGVGHQQIGEELNIREKTVTQYAKRAREKLNARTTTQAVATAVHLGLIHVDDEEQSAPEKETEHE